MKKATKMDHGWLLYTHVDVMWSMDKLKFRVFYFLILTWKLWFCKWIEFDLDRLGMDFVFVIG